MKLSEKYNIVIVPKSERDNYLTPEDKEMDERAAAAVAAALQKAKVCKKPIAKYDAETNRAYLEYPDGTQKEI